MDKILPKAMANFPAQCGKTVQFRIRLIIAGDNGQGNIAPAAAMGMMIFYTAAGVKVLHYLLSRGIESRTQAWRISVAN